MISSKAGFLLCYAAVLVACGSQEIQAPEAPNVPNMDGNQEAPKAAKTRDMSGFSKDLARFVGLKIGEPMDSAIDKIKTRLKPESEGYITGTWETSDNGEGTKTFTGLAENLPDDSVKAEEITTVFQKTEDGSYRLSEYGARIKCWRGEKPNQWTTNLCP